MLRSRWRVSVTLTRTSIKRIGWSLSARKCSASTLKVEQAHGPPLQLWTTFQTLVYRRSLGALFSPVPSPLDTAPQNHIQFHRWHPEQIRRWSVFASSGTCRKFYAKADNVMKNMFVQKTTAINYDYSHQAWFSIAWWLGFSLEKTTQ